jgi:hypothetical protein
VARGGRGAIYYLSEPTRTDAALTADGTERLYFNYVFLDTDGLADVNVGFVERLQ